MAAEWDALVAQVTATTTVEASAVLALQGSASIIAAQAQQLADTPQKQAILDQTTALKNSADALATAITANTPAA